jgi:hypothetical protein
MCFIYYRYYLHHHLYNGHQHLCEDNPVPNLHPHFINIFKNSIWRLESLITTHLLIWRHTLTNERTCYIVFDSFFKCFTIIFNFSHYVFTISFLLRQCSSLIPTLCEVCLTLTSVLCIYIHLMFCSIFM